MAKNLACNSVDAVSAVACAKKLANSARPATAKRLTTPQIAARPIHLLQIARDAQTLQVNSAIQVKALTSVERSPSIRTSSAGTGPFDSLPRRKIGTLPALTLRSIIVSTNAPADGKGVEVGGLMSRLTFILKYQITQGKKDDDGCKRAAAITLDDHIMMRCSNECFAEHLFCSGAFTGQHTIQPERVAGFQPIHHMALRFEEEGWNLWP